MMICWLAAENDIFDHHQGSDLSGRVTDLIDVVKDQQQNYVPEVIINIIRGGEGGQNPRNQGISLLARLAESTGQCLSILLLPLPHKFLSTFKIHKITLIMMMVSRRTQQCL